jgi:multiple sugar transport system ATP-binding protein
VASIALSSVSKTYANDVNAVDDVSLDIDDGELMVLVGPSGCGKTTLMRMIAGLERVTSGQILIGGRDVTTTAPKERDVAMVFQNYALYPHMSVADNIGFPLRLRGVPKAQIAAKVKVATRLLGLAESESRRPANLSGGQRQRVAMGRAIVREPNVFLMDEPLSNLDAKLRVEMRAEILNIQRRVGVATVYVTHDQTEAMTMGDRVAVLDSGRLLQCGTPQALYDHPECLSVAAFIGSPPMNLFEATVADGARRLRVGAQTIELTADDPPASLSSWQERRVVLGLRPEDLHLAEGDTAALAGTVKLVEALGSDLLVHVSSDAVRVRPGTVVDDETLDLPESEVSAHDHWVARPPPRSGVRVGDTVRLAPDLARIHLFDPATGLTLQ